MIPILLCWLRFTCLLFVMVRWGHTVKELIDATGCVFLILLVKLDHMLNMWSGHLFTYGDLYTTPLVGRVGWCSRPNVALVCLCLYNGATLTENAVIYRDDVRYEHLKSIISNINGISRQCGPSIIYEHRHKITQFEVSIEQSVYFCYHFLNINKYNIISLYYPHCWDTGVSL